MQTKILKLLILMALPVQFAFSQVEQLKTYTAERFSLQYPAIWIMAEENGIINFYPKEDYGAITVSFHSNIDFPLSRTKKIILEIMGITDDPANVKMTEKGDIIEFYYEHTIENVKWVTKAFRRNDEFYLLTINCELNMWQKEKMPFIKSLNSFKIK